jgi:hypothetical protein
MALSNQSELPAFFSQFKNQPPHSYQPKIRNMSCQDWSFPEDDLPRMAKSLKMTYLRLAKSWYDKLESQKGI